MTVAAHHDNRPHGSGCRFPVIVPIVFHARWWTGHAMGEGGVDGHREVEAGGATAEIVASTIRLDQRQRAVLQPRQLTEQQTATQLGKQT